MRRLAAWQADLLLLAVAFVWGTTFVLVKNALGEISPFAFLAIRFLLAFIFLSLLYRPGRKLSKATLIPLTIGIFLGGYAFKR